MIHVKPFRALRPPRDKAYLVATRSYLSYNQTHLHDKLSHNPYTFLHVINPTFGGDELTPAERYPRVKAAFEKQMAEGIFREDEAPAYYLYRQVKDGNEYIGLIAAVSVEDYREGRIKKHEKTLSHREEMFTDYLEATGFNAEPVLLLYQDDLRLDELFARYANQRSEYEFTSTDRVLHQLWLIENPEECALISKVFSEQPALYIADGHHRCASSAGLADRLSSAKSEKEAPHQFFMAYLIGEEQMKIYDYNRLVVNEAGLKCAEIVKMLSDHFLIEPRDHIVRPEKLHEMGMYCEGQWFKLAPRTGSFDPGDPVSHLDAEILSRNILAPVFGITDLKSDRRVDFLPGTEGLEALQARVDKGPYDLAFTLHPVTIEQIKRVSDAGDTMPPKSTYVEPKLRSGLTVYKILD